MTKLTDMLKSALEQKKTNNTSSKKTKKTDGSRSVGKSQTTNSKVTTRGSSRGS